ncbi:myoneurin isoform X2 [Phyllopteryx taeniolatus]|uniref:myoneurin isoform X2 n=1 Tax=Phyllopteryx taeniolatus TaxID=161469 RepID=UPI002AD40B45|nr:myoneurin isoform X2 [Phyllopteryx taeniolatus]
MTDIPRSQLTLIEDSTSQHYWHNTDTMAHGANHGKLLLQRLHQQREMDFLCDVTIIAEKGQDVTTLDPDKVSRYALEKLLEFVYTGQMNLSSTRQSAVRRAAIFLGMSDALKYLEDISHSSEVSEPSQFEVDNEPGLSLLSPGSPGSPHSPVSLSIVSVTGTWVEEGQESQQDQESQEGPEGQESEAAGLDEEGKIPSVELAEPSNLESDAPQPAAHRGRGRGRGKGRGRGRGRGRGGRSLVKIEEEFLEDSDTSVKDFGDTSADWSPSLDDPPAKRPRFGEMWRGRGRRRGKGRARGRSKMEGEPGEDEANGEEAAEDGEQNPSPGADEMARSCIECNRTFKDMCSLRRHEQIHAGLKPFICIFCSKTFRQATQLKTHLRTHTGEKPFSCSDCEKCFAQKCQLVAHRRMHHGEEKPYKCERCGFKFATSSNYKIHVRLHSGEKPYVCDVCGQAFAQSSTLTYHKRRHTGEKPYQCDLCGMSFSVSSSLIAHARKHTGETPYKCTQPQCESRFVTSSELKKHMRRLHPDGTNGVQCLLCGNRFASVKNMIKHQEKAHADEVRQHKERARAVVLLASSHPVAFVQSKLSNDGKSLSATPEAEPPEPEPATPRAGGSNDVGVGPSVAAALNDTLRELKVEPGHTPISQADPVAFEADPVSTINSETLHALVEQLRPPPSPAQSLEQIVIIRTVDNAEHGAPPPPPQ